MNHKFIIILKNLQQISSVHVRLICKSIIEKWMVTLLNVEPKLIYINQISSDKAEYNDIFPLQWVQVPIQNRTTNSSRLPAHTDSTITNKKKTYKLTNSFSQNEITLSCRTSHTQIHTHLRVQLKMATRAQTHTFTNNTYY